MTHDDFVSILKECVRLERTESGRYRIYGGLEQESSVVSGRTADEAFNKLAKIEFPMYLSRVWRNKDCFREVFLETNPPSISTAMRLPLHNKKDAPAIIIGGPHAREPYID